ncbi:MAG: MMPL family transporter, partial [Lentisphaerae bacterium]|nr:MMPL family transporter [Lentisphaerota bacterium]
LSLFGLVLAIGLVVDDAIVVVEAVERHIEAGLSPKAATHKAMQEVSGPVVAIALILAAVFIPTIFIPGITGRLYQQFAVTIAVSVLISAFNALSLSPALAAMLLRPRQHSRGPLSRFFAMFNRHLSTATNRYVAICALGIRKTALTLVLLLVVTLGVGGFGKLLPGTFIPEEDLGYMYLNVQLPHAASIQRTDATCRQIEEILARTPGLEYYATVCGYSMLSQVQNTYSAFFFISLQPWEQRRKPAEQYAALAANLNRELSQLPQAQAFVFPPPAIPGIGTAGGVTFLLEDRAGKDVAFLAEQVQAFIAAARQRPEIGSLNTTFLSDVPQVLVQVDREKVLKQGVDINQVYQTIQAFMGGCFINYFNRFGRQWQIYLQADGDYRARVENMGQFYVRNDRGAMVPLSTLAHIESRMGPESTMRFNLYRCAQFNASAAPGYSSAQVMRALEEVFATHMPREMGYDYLAMSFQEKQAQEGVPVWAIFGLSLLFVFLILAAQYESWSLPFSVLLGTPIAVCGAFLAIWLRGMEVSIYVQIGLIMLIGLAAKNAILIIEFAKTGQAGGLSAVEAALQAARIRLRPILMTALAFIMGCVPLWVASGSGAVSRQVLGTTVIGGMLAASAIAIFIIPVSYSFVQHLIKGRSRPPACRPAPDQEGSACS